MGESNVHDSHTGKPPVVRGESRSKISNEELDTRTGLGSLSSAAPLGDQDQAASGVQVTKPANELKTTESYNPRALWFWAEDPNSLKLKFLIILRDFQMYRSDCQILQLIL